MGIAAASRRALDSTLVRRGGDTAGGPRPNSRYELWFLVLVVPVLVTTVFLLLTLGRLSLWIDEAWVATNVIRGQVTADSLSSTPIGFFVLLKAITSMFGTNEFQFRLAALIFFVSSVVLTAVVAHRMYGRYVEACIAALLIGTNFAALSYGREVKPYAADCFFAALITLLALHVASRPTWRRWAMYVVAISVAPLVSFPSILVSASAAVFLLIAQARNADRSRWIAFFTTHAIAGVFVGVYGLVLLRSQHSDDLVTYWVSGFPPRGGGVLSTIVWAGHQLRALVGWFFTPITFWGSGEGVLQVVVAVMLGLGIIGLARRRAAYLLLLIGPAVLAVLSGILGLYPFDGWLGGRLLLFLLPGATLLAAGGIGLAIRPTRAGRTWHVPLAAGMLAVALILAGRGMYALFTDRELGSVPRQEVRDLITADLLPQLQAGDSIYAYFLSVQAFEYYAPALRGENRWTGNYTVAERQAVNVIYGGVYGDVPDKYVEELQFTLNKSSGGRLWIVLSGVKEPDENLNAVVKTIEADTTIEGVWHQRGASLYLVRAAPNATSNRRSRSSL